jgi:hypothetical protein
VRSFFENPCSISCAEITVFTYVITAIALLIAVFVFFKIMHAKIFTFSLSRLRHLSVIKGAKPIQSC